MQRTDYRGQAVFKQLLLVILTGIAISLFLHSRVFAYEYGARIKVNWSFEAYKDANKADVIDLIQNEIIPETHGINGKGMRIKALVTFSDGVYLYDNADESFKKVKLSSTSTKKSKKAKPGKKKKSSKSSSKKTKKPKANKKKTSKSKKKKTSIKNLSTKAKGSTSGSKKNKTGKTKKKSTAGHSGKEHSSGGGKKKNKTGKTKKKSSGGHSGGGHSGGRGGKTVQYTFNLNVESYKNDNKKLPINPKMQGKKKRSYTSKRLIEALPAPTSEYYDFLGWFTKKKDGEKIEIPYTIGTKNKTLYAHWREKEYTITFSADEPGLVMPAAVKYKRTEGITLPEYSGPGYSYDGWEIRGYGEVNVKELKKNDWDGDLDLRAMPREHSYKIVFEGSEGGTVNNSPIELMWSEERYPPDPICTPPADKIFDCWVWNGKEFRSWTEIKSLTPEDKATIHFVAKWKLAYNGNAIAEYAIKNAPNTKELCAGFVSDCLIENDVKMTKQRGVGYLYNELINVGFKAYDINSNGGCIYTYGSENNKLIEIGDVIIFKCLSCSAKEKPWKHVAIVTAIMYDGKIGITHVNPGYHINDTWGGTYNGGCGHGSSNMEYILMKR